VRKSDPLYFRTPDKDEYHDNMQQDDIFGIILFDNPFCADKSLGGRAGGEI
jgi:hypothetical protein